MKNILGRLLVIGALLGGVGLVLSASAAPTPPALGGTGTSQIPAPGQTLIGNASGTYTPAPITCTGNCSITTSSGGIAVNVANQTTLIVGTSGISIVQSGTNATATLNTSFAASWTGLETFLNGLVAKGNVQLSSSTNCAVVKTDGSGTVSCGTAVTSVVSSSQIGVSAASGGGISFSVLMYYLTSAIQSINNATSSAHTIVGGTGVNVTTVAGSSNSTTTITNTGVTSYNGSTGAVTGGSSNVSTSTANTWTAVQTFSVGEVVNGTVTLGSTTNALLVTNGAGAITGYIATACTSGQAVTGVSATGTLTCSGFATSTGINATGTAFAFPYWNGAGTSLTPTSTLFFASSTGYIGVNTANPKYNIQVVASSSVGGVTGIETTDSAFPTSSNVLVGSIKSGDGTYAEPQIWMGQYAVTPSLTNYIFNLDDNGSGGTVLNAPGTNNISLRLNNVNKLFISGSTGNIGIGTDSALPSSTLQVKGTFQVNGTSTFVGNVATPVTNALLSGNSSGIVTGYGGSNCTGGQFQTGVSATGTALCSTPAGAATTTIAFGNTTFSGPNFTLFYAATTTDNGIVTSSPNGFTFLMLASSTWAKVSNNLSDLTSTSSARTNLGYSAGLKLVISATGTISVATTSISQWANDSGFLTSLSGALLAANNLSDLNSTSSARTNLGFTGGTNITISATGTIQCPSCLTANQTITLSGAVTGSGTTAITTTFTTSTLYGLFSGTSPITFNTSTGAIGCPTCGSGGGVSTGTVLTVGSPFTVQGNASSSLSGNATTTSVIPNLNSVYYLPTDFTTKGCVGSSTATTFQGCVGEIYKYAQGTGVSGVKVVVTQSIPVGSWTGTLNASTTNGAYFPLSLECVNNAQLVYSGSGRAVQMNFGNPYGHFGSEWSGCTYMGSSTAIHAGQTNNATTTGIYFGGGTANVNGGAVGVNFHDNNLNGFGRQIEIGTNAYMLALNNVNMSGGNGGGMDGSCLYVNPSSNSGERNVLNQIICTDPGNSTSSKAIYFADGGTASNFIHDLSIDDAQVWIGFSNGLTSIDKIHVENAAYSNYGRYIPFWAVSSQANMLSLTNVEIANDTSGANSFDTIVKHGVNLYASAIHIDNYGGGTISQFSDHSLNNGSESEVICQIQTSNGSGLTNIIGGSGAQPYSQAAGATCSMDVANSYPVSIIQNSNNVADIRNGNKNVATFDQNGNWTFLNNATVGGDLLDPSGNKYSTSTSGGGGVATTTPFSAGYIPTVSSSLALTNSNIFQLNTASTSIVTPTSTISFDNSAGSFQASVTSSTISYTTAGTNRMLFVSVVGDITNDKITGVTYAGASMTLNGKVNTPGDRWFYLFSLANPALGANNVVVSASGATNIATAIASYGGVKQTGQPEAIASGTVTSATSITATTTTLTANDWMIVGVDAPQSSLSGNATSTNRQANGGLQIWDTSSSLGTVGTYGISLSTSTAGGWGWVVVAVAPAPAVTTSTITSRVGIGTTQPSSTLHVAGNLQVDATSTLKGNVSISGTTAVNGVPVLDAGGDFIGPNIFVNGANSLITQNVTGTSLLGVLIQSGGVMLVTASTTLTGPNFCTGGLNVIASTTGNVTITFPSMATLASSTLTPCASSIWSSGFSTQFVVNSSTFNVTQATNGPNEQILYAPGTPTTLAPGQVWEVTGQFVNTSTVSGATSPGMVLQAYVSLYATSTITNALIQANSVGGYQGCGGTACSGGQVLSGLNGNASGTCVTVSGGAGTSTVTIPTITVSSQSGATYPNASLKQAVVACANTTAFPNGATIAVPDSSYTVTSTLQLASGCNIVGVLGYTQINFNATSSGNLNSPGSVLIAASGTANYAGFQNLILNQTSSTYSGTAWNMSNFGHSYVNNIKSQTFRYSIYGNDTTNSTFYNNVSNWHGFDDSGFYASSTNPINKNEFWNVNFFPNQSNTAGAKYGWYINNGQHNTVVSGHSEPANQANTTGIRLESVNAEDNMFIGSYLELNATSTWISNGAQRNLFVGGEWVSPLTGAQNFVDGGTDTQVWGADNNFASSINQFGITASSTFVDKSSGSQTLSFLNNTSFAHVGSSLINIQLLNGSDSSNALKIDNAGTGRSLLVTNGGTQKFAIDNTSSTINVPLKDASGNKYSTSTPTYTDHWQFANETSNQIDIVDQGFYVTSTIKDVFAGNFFSGTSVASGSITFNLGFATSCSSATSTWQKLFTSDQTVSSVGSSTKLTPNGSTTWAGANAGGLPWLLCYYTGGNSSSSEFSGVVHYTQP